MDVLEPVSGDVTLGNDHLDSTHPALVPIADFIVLITNPLIFRAQMRPVI